MPKRVNPEYPLDVPAPDLFSAAIVAVGAGTTAKAVFLTSVTDPKAVTAAAFVGIAG
jgi:hypothetical protein